MEKTYLHRGGAETRRKPKQSSTAYSLRSFNQKPSCKVFIDPYQTKFCSAFSVRATLDIRLVFLRASAVRLVFQNYNLQIVNFKSLQLVLILLQHHPDQLASSANTGLVEQLLERCFHGALGHM
jgi:hypothetical protein